MAILSKSQLGTFANTVDLSESTKYFSARNQAKGTKMSIFLSHKHSDLKELQNIKKILEGLGVSVYIDWLDREMPEITSKKTAERIKEKIKQNDKFILIATDNAIDSKWCNWELGFGDAQKYEDEKIALFPIRENGKDWSGNEYMELYPLIEYEDGNSYYIEKINRDDGCCYVPKQKGIEDKPIKGKIPKGYYVSMKCEFPEVLDISITLLIKIEDWLKYF
jgi:hypothetical protein